MNDKPSNGSTTCSGSLGQKVAKERFEPGQSDDSAHTLLIAVPDNGRIICLLQENVRTLRSDSSSSLLTALKEDGV